MLRGQRETHRQSGEDLTCAVVEFAGDVPPFFVLSLQQTTGEIAELFGLLHDLGGADANFGVQGFCQCPVFFLGTFQVGNVDSGRVKEEDIALVVADGMNGEVDDALGAVGPMVGQGFPIGSTLRGLHGSSANFILHVLGVSPPAGSPRTDVPEHLRRDSRTLPGTADSRR